MSRDRLAAIRAQQGVDNSTNPYGRQDARSYEMADVTGSTAHLVSNAGGAGGGDSMTEFYSEISAVQDDLRTFNDNVTRIGELHARSLNNVDDYEDQKNAKLLEKFVDDTRALSSALKSRIKALERQGGTGRDIQIRKQQSGLVKSKFMEAIQNYQAVEQQHRTRHKQRLERQFKIVKPDATPEEVRAVVNDEGGGQIFSQALMSTNRNGESRAAYREVQERHEEIKRIERTLGELAQLFNDMSVMVAQQDDTIQAIETHAYNTERDMEAGVNYTTKAVDSARAARKKRWICFAIIIVILIIIAIIIVIKHPWKP